MTVGIGIAAARCMLEAEPVGENAAAPRRRRRDGRPGASTPLGLAGGSGGRTRRRPRRPHEAGCREARAAADFVAFLRDRHRRYRPAGGVVGALASSSAPRVNAQRADVRARRATRGGRRTASARGACERAPSSASFATRPPRRSGVPYGGRVCWRPASTPAADEPCIAPERHGTRHLDRPRRPRRRDLARGLLWGK